MRKTPFRSSKVLIITKVWFNSWKWLTVSQEKSANYVKMAIDNDIQFYNIVQKFFKWKKALKQTIIILFSKFLNHK